MQKSEPLRAVSTLTQQGPEESLGAKLVVPIKVLRRLGWKKGDLILWEISEDGSATLRRL